MKKWKTKAIVVKPRKNRQRTSISNDKKENYNGDNANNTDTDQAKDKYLVSSHDGKEII